MLLPATKQKVIEKKKKHPVRHAEEATLLFLNNERLQTYWRQRPREAQPVPALFMTRNLFSAALEKDSRHI